MKRTAFISVASAGTGALLVSAAIPVGAAVDAAPDAAAAGVALNAWIRIDPDGWITIASPQSEMGQGIHTTQPAVIADELDADWSRVRLAWTGIDPAFKNPVVGWQFTGDAQSIRSFWPVLRTMGASARDVLVRAAAAAWSVPASELTTASSTVRHAATGRSASYASLAPAAAKLEPPAQPRLKTAAEWTILRKPQPRAELGAKVTGSAVFGIDVRVPNMVYAAVATAPTIDGDVATVREGAIAHRPGVVGVVRIPRGVAVVATSYWRARSALAALPIAWSTGPAATLSTAALDAQYRAVLDGDAWTPVVPGDAIRPALAAARAGGGRVVDAEYASAWQAHATMEPMNCTASVDGDRVHLWAPTQGPTQLAVDVSKALGIPAANVTLTRTYLGGGFGRRLFPDFAVQAALVSRAVKRPVKLIWSREEDFHRDSYRPKFVQALRASLDADGMPTAVEQRVVAPTILSPVIVGLPKKFAFPQADPSCLEGFAAESHLYAWPRRLDFHLLDVVPPTMVWRTTGYGPNIFAIESFVDELARAAGIAPLAYRKRLLAHSEHGARAIPVLDLLAAKTQLDRPRPAGRGVGIAIAFCFATYIAQAIEVSVGNGVVDIHRVVTALDGGYVLDPEITRANIEGGTVWGLTQALISEITFANGAAQQRNYDGFKLLALPEAPKTELYWIDSGANPGGLGEVGPVPTAPALANAIAAAGGPRIRSLPIARHGLHTRYAKQFAARENDTWSA